MMGAEKPEKDNAVTFLEMLSIFKQVENLRQQKQFWSGSIASNWVE